MAVTSSWREREREREREEREVNLQINFLINMAVYSLKPVRVYIHMDACVCRVMLGAANTQLAGQSVDYSHTE